VGDYQGNSQGEYVFHKFYLNAIIIMSSTEV
jgi:hypothetical protein